MNSRLARDANENKRQLRAQPFTLDEMATFVLQNHQDMASSSIVVAVTVMQKFFGADKVEKALTLDASKSSAKPAAADASTRAAVGAGATAATSA